MIAPTEIVENSRPINPLETRYCALACLTWHLMGKSYRSNGKEIGKGATCIDSYIMVEI
jgi:hypothetical protein